MNYTMFAYKSSSYSNNEYEPSELKYLETQSEGTLVVWWGTLIYNCELEKTLYEIMIFQNGVRMSMPNDLEKEALSFKEELLEERHKRYEEYLKLKKEFTEID